MHLFAVTRQTDWQNSHNLTSLNYFAITVVSNVQTGKSVSEQCMSNWKIAKKITAYTDLKNMDNWQSTQTVVVSGQYNQAFMGSHDESFVVMSVRALACYQRPTATVRQPWLSSGLQAKVPTEVIKSMIYPPAYIAVLIYFQPSWNFPWHSPQPFMCFHRHKAHSPLQAYPIIYISQWTACSSLLRISLATAHHSSVLKMHISYANTGERKLTTYSYCR